MSAKALGENWISIDWDTFERNENIDSGVDFDLFSGKIIDGGGLNFVSPYIVPTHVRSLLSNFDKLNLQFGYITGEKLVEERLNEYTVAKFGKHSSRVYELSYDLKKLYEAAKRENQDPGTLVISVLDNLDKTTEIENYDYANYIVQVKRDELLDDLLQPCD
jgi:hypothetical protein